MKTLAVLVRSSPKVRRGIFVTFCVEFLSATALKSSRANAKMVLRVSGSVRSSDTES